MSDSVVLFTSTDDIEFIPNWICGNMKAAEKVITNTLPLQGVVSYFVRTRDHDDNYRNDFDPNCEWPRVRRPADTTIFMTHWPAEQQAPALYFAKKTWLKEGF